jgi:hypothetical protein
MKTEYLTSPEMRKVFLRHTEHELTLCIGDNAFDNLKASLAHAKALLESRRFDSVVYVNLPFSSRRFTDTRREVFPKSEKNAAFVVVHNHIGRLGPEFGSVKDAVDAAKGKVAVIINSWEFASSSYRYKEQLLFALHSLVCADEVTVFVYSQARSEVVPGEIHRAGLGRLTAFAIDVMRIPDEEEPYEKKPFFVDEMMRSAAGGVPEGAQPTPSKIKDLPYADAPLEKVELREMAVAA